MGYAERQTVSVTTGPIEKQPETGVPLWTWTEILGMVAGGLVLRRMAYERLGID